MNCSGNEMLDSRNMICMTYAAEYVSVGLFIGYPKRRLF